MESRVDYRRTRYAVFFLLAVTINIIDGVITRSVSDTSRRTLVAAAASVDLIVVISAIYYWLLVRVGIRSRESLIAIFLLGALHASLLYSNARAVTAWIGGLCEAGLIGFVVVQLRRQTRRTPGSPEVDPLDAMQAALKSVFPNSVARVGAFELSIFYYALFSWRAAPFVPRGAQGFSLHRESGQADLLYVLAIASLVEIPPVHLLLGHWSRGWAWIVTSLSLYAVIWLTGLARSICLRPALVGPEYVDLKFGLIFRLRVPREMISAARRAQAKDTIISSVVVPRRSEPNVYIELFRPIRAEGPFGIGKSVTGLALAVDEETEFRLALERLLEIDSGSDARPGPAER